MNWKENLIYLGVFLLTLLIFVEVIYLLFPEPGAKTPVFDDELGYMPAPNQDYILRSPEAVARIQTNSLGFRDTEFSTEKTSFRIAIFGDSQTFGSNVDFDEIYPTRLDHSLQNIEVYNFALGHGERKIRVVEKFAPEYNPDLIVFSLYLGDFQNVHYTPKQYEEAILSQKKWSPKVIEKLEHIYLYNIYARRPFQKVLWGIRGHLSELGIVSKARHSWDVIYVEKTQSQVEDFYLLLSRLEEVAKASEERGVPFLIYLLPDRYHVYPDWFYEYIDLNQLDREDFDMHQAMEDIMDFCEEKALTCYDARMDMEQYRHEPLYFYDDFHLTPYGHYATAQILESVLWEKGLLESTQ